MRMKRHWKKIVIGVVVLVALVLGGSFIYAKFINKADDPLSQQDVLDKLDATTTTIVVDTTAAISTDTTIAAGDTTTTATPATGVDGNWTIAAESEVGYRVDESINGFATTANGRTNAITGSLAIAGTTATTGDFTVDMTTFKSDESRRDGQFNGRIMAVDQFPTATFVLTAPIDFRKIPADGETISASATGDLTLRGTTNSVTFDLQATFKNNRIGVLGQIPIVFADYGIPNPSIATISTEDNGLLEFVLIFDRAA
ncbi:MAG: YceI family protein [Actinobacteria bacterium]|nr:YceI family protein [Actinomycetota bacterium]